MSSPLFVESERLSCFLRYIAAETLAGRGEGIKEYNIGVEVYGRRVGYDTKADAIVRVEAGRLRSKLEKYYAGQGATDLVRIELPRGTYVPVFSGEALAKPSLAGPAAGKNRVRKAVFTAGLATLVTLVAVAWFHGRADRDQAMLSMAVLPFVQGGSDGEAARLSRAFVDELTGTIAREDAFLVASPGTSERFRGSPQDLVAAGSRWHVNALLEGSMQSVSGRLRVTVQLVAARSGRPVWSQTYESLPGRSAEFQEKVCNLIARTLRARFGGIPASGFGKPFTQNDGAMALYVKGHEAWLTQRRSGLLESLDYFRQAIARDADFAKAYEGIAASELFLASLDHPRADEHVIQAKAAAQKAIALDDRLADAHGRLGNILLRREWNFVKAEEELQRSVVLDPGYPPVTRWYSEAARAREHYADARTELENGLLANPNSAMIETELGLLDLQLDRVADAEAHLQQTLAGSPNYRPAHLLAGLLHERAGRFTEAENELRLWSNESEFGRLCLAALGHVYGAEGKAREALQVAGQLEAFESRYMSLSALVYLAMGDRGRALDALEKAYAERDKFLPVVKIDARIRPLLFEPRFRALMDKLGLPTALQ